MSRTYRRVTPQGKVYFELERRRRPWAEWQRLLEVAPALKALIPFSMSEPVPPYPTSDAAFLAIAACFADPIKREALTSLIFDAMSADLKDLFIAHCERMHGWKPQQRRQGS